MLSGARGQVMGDKIEQDPGTEKLEGLLKTEEKGR